MTTSSSSSSSSSRSWEAFRSAHQDFADTVRARFGLYRHHVLATLRKDGSPRVTGLEVDFRFGELLLGMMPDSRKALDLLRDPRFAVQANPGPDAEMADGDVRISGRAVEVTDPAFLARFTEEAKPPEPFQLFRGELDEVLLTTLGSDAMVLRLWRPGAPVRTIHRPADGTPYEA
ncbi:pyridoxamine 5'-phosphate oxidase family protein [Streptomyces sp. NPDC047985]|uniref:pyridoxamine 5'-phosphate oxidase family protein n=1 Tax=unclassified Streptomyces TaxID=2593676 RepID=UPI0034472663